MTTPIIKKTLKLNRQTAKHSYDGYDALIASYHHVKTLGGEDMSSAIHEQRLKNYFTSPNMHKHVQRAWTMLELNQLKEHTLFQSYMTWSEVFFKNYPEEDSWGFNASSADVNDPELHRSGDNQSHNIPSNNGSSQGPICRSGCDDKREKMSPSSNSGR